MGRIAERIILGILALFLLIYVGYQVYISLYGTIKTDTIYEYTVSRAISVEGIAIRPDTVLDGQYTGVENYLFEDGTRISVGESVAEFYESGRSDQNLRRARELEAEIKMLTEAQDATVNNFSSTESLNRDIKEQLGYLTELSYNGRFSSSHKVRTNLISLVNKKQIATGKATDFEARITALTAEYDRIKGETSGNSIMVAKAPASGYFSRDVDGYENIASPEAVADYGIQDYLALLDSSVPVSNGQAVGRITTTQNWQFIATASKSALEFVRPGQEVYITFEDINQKIPASVIDILQEKDEERAVLILACNQVSGELLKVRKSAAIINFSQYTGLRVNISDLRFQGEASGVYVVDNNMVRFKQIDVIYEEQSFVLSRLLPPDSKEGEFVRLFDRVITKGNDLYDGKVIP